MDPNPAAKGSRLFGGAATEETLASSASILARAGYAGQKGLQQFFTPSAVAEWIADVFGYPGPVLDPTAGAGNLLAPHGAQDRFGIELDADYTGKNAAYNAIQGDFQAVYPLLRRVGVRFPAIVANPPFGLLWQEPSLHEGRASSTLLTYLACLQLLENDGQGAFIAGADRFEREILPRPEPRHVYAIVDVPDLFGSNVELPCLIAFFTEESDDGSNPTKVPKWHPRSGRAQWFPEPPKPLVNGNSPVGVNDITDKSRRYSDFS